MKMSAIGSSTVSCKADAVASDANSHDRDRQSRRGPDGVRRVMTPIGGLSRAFSSRASSLQLGQYAYVARAPVSDWPPERRGPAG
jgi:hypothetical protein